jgi:hypothetical protein
MIPRTIPTRRQAKLSCFVTGLTIAASAALMTAATLAPAPLAVIPLLVIVCIGCPLAMAWTLPSSITILRMPDPDDHAVAALRRELAGLPETEHPHGY